MTRPVANNIPVSLGYRQRMKSRPAYVHRGIDYAAPAGTPVRAAAAGHVVHVGYGGLGGTRKSGFGYHVVIKTGTIFHVYGHLSGASVKVGQQVTDGQQVARTGSSGNVTGPHLHYGELKSFSYLADRQPLFSSLPTGKPGKHWLTLELVNHKAATIALSKPGALAGWILRRARLVNITKAARPDVLVGLECGSGAAWRYLNVKYAAFGLQRVAGGKEGRHLWRRTSTVTEVFKSGAIDTPAKLRAGGRNMPSPWLIGDVNGTPGMVVGFHLDYRATDDQRVRSALHIIDEAVRIALANGLDRSRVMFAGDAASDDWVRSKAFEARVWKDAYDTARESQHAEVKSYNEGKPSRRGPRVDGIYTYWGKGPGKGAGHARPVADVRQILDSVATDHNVMTASIERQ